MIDFIAENLKYDFIKFHSVDGGSRTLNKREFSAQSVIESVSKNGVKWIDLQFTDLLGGLQHITIPSSALTDKSFSKGVNKLDGSSIKGFKEIHESDMVMRPDPSTYAVLPFFTDDQKTARLLVDIYEGGSTERFSRDPR